MESEQSIRYRHIRVNDINLHVRFAGSEHGNPIILLHGFPDASFGWEFQMEALANLGYYVIAPDQRGYNLSDKPKGKANYRMNLLVYDIIALADELKFEKFHLAGHDFGAIVSWHLLEHFSHRVTSVVILNVPHPKVMWKYQKENKKQRRKSWYAYFFKIPRIPEFFIRVSRYNMLKSAMKESFSKEKLQRYKTAWSQPGALTAMINWYRCLFQLTPEEQPSKTIDVPTLIIWGKQDPHLMWEMAEESASMCTNGRVEFIEEATHWVLEDAPEKTTALMINHFLKNKN